MQVKGSRIRAINIGNYLSTGNTAVSFVKHRSEAAVYENIYENTEGPHIYFKTTWKPDANTVAEMKPQFASGYRCKSVISNL